MAFVPAWRVNRMSEMSDSGLDSGILRGPSRSSDVPPWTRHVDRSHALHRCAGVGHPAGKPLASMIVAGTAITQNIWQL